MPIKFRCQHCQQFLGISRAKAGTITDCPTCGRTIRVPNLDGELEALPAPELNLDDSELVSALGKLANIGLPVDANRPEIAVAEHPGLDRPARELDAATPSKPAPPAPAMRPEPIVLALLAAAVIELPSPIAPAPSVAPDTSRGARGAEISPGQAANAPNGGALPPTVHHDLVSSESPSPAGPPVSPLEQLARQGSGHDSQADRPTYGSTLKGRSTARNGAIIAAVVCLPLGFLAGWMAASTGSKTDSEAVIAGEDAGNAMGAEGGAAQPIANLQPAINGRLTYVSASGDSHPDSGARILVLPDTRDGTAKMTVEPFRSGAAEGDLRIAVAAIRAAGGDFVVADQDGRFTVSLPKVGGYQLLLMSHYQPRDERDLLEPGTMSLLQQYFDRPTQLIGATAYHLSRFSYRGDGASPRDHTFDRAL